jgi:hypothetical protein
VHKPAPVRTVKGNDAAKPAHDPVSDKGRAQAQAPVKPVKPVQVAKGNGHSHDEWAEF